MIKCGQIIEHKAESICGLDICCYDCDHKCDKACKENRDDCEYLRNTDEEAVGLNNTPTQLFVNKNPKLLNDIYLFQSQMDKMKVQEELLREKLKVAMKEFNLPEFETDLLKVTLSKPYTRTSTDTKKLKAELPDIAKKYEKVTEVQGKLTIVAKVKETRLQG